MLDPVYGLTHDGRCCGSGAKHPGVDGARVLAGDFAVAGRNLPISEFSGRERSFARLESEIVAFENSPSRRRGVFVDIFEIE